MISSISIVCLIAGAALALLRGPVYSAQARLYVGSTDARSASIPGIVAASGTLAQTYSRLMATDPALQTISSTSGIPKAQLAGHLSASAVVSSPIVVVTAAATDQASAVKMANAGADGLAQQVKNMNPNSPDSLLQRYQEATNQLLSVQSEATSMQAKANADPKNQGLAQSANQKRNEADGVQLQVDALKTAYSNTVDAGNFGLQTVQPAVALGSDRMSNIQFYGFIGFLIGLVIITAVCVFRDSRHAGLHRLKSRSVEEKQPILVANS